MLLSSERVDESISLPSYQNMFLLLNTSVQQFPPSQGHELSGFGSNDRWR